MRYIDANEWLNLAIPGRAERLERQRKSTAEEVVDRAFEGGAYVLLAVQVLRLLGALVLVVLVGCKKEPPTFTDPVAADERDRREAEAAYNMGRAAVACVRTGDEFLNRKTCALHWFREGCAQGDSQSCCHAERVDRELRSAGLPVRALDAEQVPQSRCAPQDGGGQ